MTTATITTTIKKSLAYRPSTKYKARYYDLTLDETTGPTGIDSLSNAITLYTTMRGLWRKGTLAENGVCYVKVNGEFVEIKIKRPKF
jgi:hypothetical protein